MGYPPPPITRRQDGAVVLFSLCRDGVACNLIAQRLPSGWVRLAYHGTAEHSIVLNFDQQLALADVLGAFNHDRNNEEQDHE